MHIIHFPGNTGKPALRRGFAAALAFAVALSGIGAASAADAAITLTQDCESIVGSGTQTYHVAVDDSGSSYGRAVLGIPDGFDPDTLCLGSWTDAEGDSIPQITVEVYDGDEIVYSQSTNDDAGDTEEEGGDTVTFGWEDGWDTIIITPEEEVSGVNGMYISGTADTSGGDLTLTASLQAYGDSGWTNEQEMDITTYAESIDIGSLSVSSSASSVSYLGEFTVSVSGISVDAPDVVDSAEVSVNYTEEAYIDTITLPVFDGADSYEIYLDGTKVDTGSAQDGVIYVNGRASVIRVVVSGSSFTQTGAMEITARNTASSSTEVIVSGTLAVSYNGETYSSSSNTGTISLSPEITDDSGSGGSSSDEGASGDSGTSEGSGSTSDGSDSTSEGSGSTSDGSDSTSEGSGSTSDNSGSASDNSGRASGSSDNSGSSDSSSSSGSAASSSAFTSTDGTEDTTVSKTVVDLSGINLTATKVSASGSSVQAQVVDTTGQATEALRTAVSSNAGSSVAVVYGYSNENQDADTLTDGDTATPVEEIEVLDDIDPISDTNTSLSSPDADKSTFGDETGGDSQGGVKGFFGKIWNVLSTLAQKFLNAGRMAWIAAVIIIAAIIAVIVLLTRRRRNREDDFDEDGFDGEDDDGYDEEDDF